MSFGARAAARALDDAALRSWITTRSEELRRGQAELAEYVAELAERTRLAMRVAGRSDKAGPAHSMVEVQALTGMNRNQTRSLIEVGELLHTVTEPLPDGAAGPSHLSDASPTSAPGWLSPIADAIRCASISVEKANLIRAGIGEPNDRVTTAELVAAVRELVEIASVLSPEQLRTQVRITREQLDHQWVTDEEHRIQDNRSVVLRRHGDGSGTLIARLDRESTVVVAELLDAATGPKRFGPRFTSADGLAAQTRTVNDPRSIDQLAHDTLLTIIRLGLAADPAVLPGRQPAVRVVVTATDLTAGTGYGQLEGTGNTVGIDTVQRRLCDTGSVTVTVDAHGAPLNYGRTRRLFSPHQRTALAIRDGGCMHPDCDRPASWCEAHHLTPWQNGHGQTDLNNGILLCRYHHLDLHNRGARISYQPRDATHRLHEPDGTVHTLHTKARIRERLQPATAATAAAAATGILTAPAGISSAGSRG